MKDALWWANALLALLAAAAFFAGFGKLGALCFALSVLCGMAQRWTSEAP